LGIAVLSSASSVEPRPGKALRMCHHFIACRSLSKFVI